MNFHFRWTNSKKPVSGLEGFFLRLRLGKWAEGLGGTGYHVARIEGMLAKSLYTLNRVLLESLWLIFVCFNYISRCLRWTKLKATSSEKLSLGQSWRDGLRCWVSVYLKPRLSWGKSFAYLLVIRMLNFFFYFFLVILWCEEFNFVVSVWFKEFSFLNIWYCLPDEQEELLAWWRSAGKSAGKRGGDDIPMAEGLSRKIQQRKMLGI